MPMPSRLALAAARLALVFAVALPVSVRGAAVTESDLGRELAELAAHFTWAPLEHQAPVVQITVTGDPGGEWFVTPRSGGEVELKSGRAPDPGFSCELDAATLDRLYRGELSGMTAAGKGSGDEKSPLEVLPGSAIKENAPRTSLGPVFHFLTHFWNRSDPETIALGRDHARPLSGVSLVGLYYYPGFRSAWYAVKGKESLNGDGDSSPYPQAYVVIRGKARIQIDRRAVEVPAGESIYIPPGAKHAVQSQDGAEVEVLWLAWGDGA
jgi:mannose-6-phosphate isomerase-like protein (cupin superfamily)